MTESFWGQFPLELDSEFIVLGIMIGIFICVIVVFTYVFAKMFLDIPKEERRADKIRKHLRKYHSKEGDS